MIDYVPDIVSQAMSSKWSKGSSGPAGDEVANLVAHALRGEGFDASVDGTGRGTPLVPVSFAIQAGALRENPDSGPDGVGIQADHAYTLEARAEVQAIAFAENSRGELRLQGGDGSVAPQLTTGGGKPGQGQPCIAFSAKDHGGDAIEGLSPTLRAGGFTGSHANAGVMPAIAFQPRFARNDRGGPSEIAYPLTAEAGRTGKGDSAQCVATNWAVRRLTPKECERLQGFPDGYTDVPWRNKNWTPDGPRYKSLGNSMAVNAMRWLGRRIEMVSALSSQSGNTP